ncbi:MAG: LD-carboxypeptidase [Burkholderiales bacterium]|nr:LD-carboxypeptidase [Burkholderiales bacterium]
MDRRRLMCLAIAATLAPTVLARESGRLPRIQRSSPLRRIKPPALRRGDLVALFSPGGAVEDSLIHRSTQHLESLGLRVMHAARLRAVRGNTAGTIGQRLTDVHALFANPEVRALWAVRGGSGTAQLLPYLDYDLVRRNPKIVVGYSDITALTLALFARAGLVGFHAPVASSSFSPFTVENLTAALFEGRMPHVQHTAPEHERRAGAEPHFAQRTINGGSAEGVLLGGNLSVLASLVGTPYLPDVPRMLLFLEEISESPYRIDRMLTQLQQAGVLSQAAAVLMGIFVKCDIAPGDDSLPLQQALSDHFSSRPVPATYGLSFGHVASQWVLPVGIRGRFDADARTLTLLESAVTPR